MKFFIVLFMVFMCSVANASQTWVVLGDSIMSRVNSSTVNGMDGTANQLSLHLVSAERNVVIKNLSSPGHSLSATDHTGFGNISTELSNIGGMFSYYDGIIIQAGTNDFERDAKWEDMVISVRKILDHARSMNKKVMMMEPIWRRDEAIPNAQANTLNTYRFFLNIVCNQEYADICHFASIGNTVLGSSAGSIYYDANEQATSTEVHLNAEGHRKFADWIKLEATSKGWF